MDNISLSVSHGPIDLMENNINRLLYSYLCTTHIPMDVGLSVSGGPSLYDYKSLCAVKQCAHSRYVSHEAFQSHTLTFKPKNSTNTHTHTDRFPAPIRTTVACKATRGEP